MKRIILSIFAIFALSILAIAQGETGQISGTVTDANGAVVPNASVTAKSVTTGFSRSTTTNDSGYFALVNLQPSKYEITIKASNFEEYKITRDLGVAGNVQIDAKLVVTGQKAVVDVVGSSITEINTSDQNLSGTVTSTQLQELPTISRNPYGFVNTLGNVSDADPSGRGVGVAVNGQRAASTSILINGGENVDTFRATPGQSIPLDSVQEFKVISGSFTAEFGRASGGVVNLVTRSGQNSFFGSGYLFNRNSKLSSGDFDTNARGIEKQFFNRNQYGFAIGGPIVKNKLLFFNNTEWLKIRSSGTTTSWVPTNASIAAANVATRNFFNGYNLSATPTGRTTSLAGTGANVLNFQEVRYSVPINTGAGLPVDSISSVGRVDWNPTSKFQLFGVFSIEDLENPEGSVANSPYQGFSTGNTDRNINFTTSGTYNFSSNLIGVTRFTYNRLENQHPLGSQPTGPTLYMRTTALSLGGVRVAMPGYLPFNPGSAIPFGGPQQMYTASQELTWIKGDHILKGGFAYYYLRDNRTFGAFQNSVQTLGANNTQAVDNFFAGTLQSYQGAINPNGRFPGQTITLPVSAPSFSRDNRYNEYAFYLQDSFKLLPGFTANLGIRYEFYGPQRNSDPSLDFNFYFGNGNSLAQRIRNGSVQNAQSSPVGNLWQKDNNNWAPSVGFAYDVEGNGKSSIRGGYALRYERNFGNVTFNVIQNPSAYGVVAITSADIGGAPIAITRSNAGPLAGNTGSVILPRVSLRHVREDIVNAYSHQWSASFDRKFGNDLLLGASYSGTSGRSLYTLENINRVGSGTTYLGSTVSCPGLAAVDRLACQYGAINTRANNGYSTYHGLTFSALSSNLFNKNVSLASYYTFAKSKD
ncbi:MAG: TonB-dependent receptor, partial [Pyrinomonadaceae bacterium]|nr:TonB-dependent receptor [Pyrinomonadaceae bacterium]